MKETVAIPAHLEKPELSEEEQKEMAEKYGHQPLTKEQIMQRQLDEIEHTAKVEAEAKVKYKKDRALEYGEKMPPPDQLDEIWRAIGAIFEASGIAPPETVAAMMKTRADIKAANPPPAAADDAQAVENVSEVKGK